MLLLATCCTIAALASPSPGPHVGWEPLGDDLRRPVEIDRARIRRDGGLVDVWIRVRGEPEAVAREFEAAGVRDEDVRRVRASLHHSLHLWSFHCDDGSHALAVSSYYARDGSMIREFRPVQPAYWPVQPETIGQQLLVLACGPARDGGLADGDAAPPDAEEAADRDAAPRRAGDPAAPAAR